MDSFTRVMGVLLSVVLPLLALGVVYYWPQEVEWPEEFTPSGE